MTEEKIKQEYLSAIVYFINRENQKIEKSMMYPITRVELNEFEENRVVKVKTFVVKARKWVIKND